MSIGQQIINGTYGLDNRPLTAYEELKVWCEKNNIPCDFWKSEYTSKLCARFGDDLFVFNKDGTFSHIEQRETLP